MILFVIATLGLLNFFFALGTMMNESYIILYLTAPHLEDAH
jgi:hypothetical protein